MGETMVQRDLDWLDGRQVIAVGRTCEYNCFVAIDIDSITEEKFNITNIETQTYKDLAQDESILAFTKEK